MRIINRNEIVILENNLIDTEEQWTQQSYEKNSKVIHNHIIYQTKERTSEAPPKPPWSRIGTANSYAAFDTFLNTKSTHENRIHIKFSSFGTNAIFLGGLKAQHLTINIYNTHNNELIENTNATLIKDKLNWQDYFFSEFIYRKTFLYIRKTLTRFITTEIIITGKDIEISSIIAGAILTIGDSLVTSNKITSLDFSKINTDEYGLTAIEKRGAKQNNIIDVIARFDNLDYITNALEKIRANFCVFIISDACDSLVNFGFLKNYEISTLSTQMLNINLEIEGVSNDT